MVVHPGERRRLIEEAEITRADALAVKPAERAQPIVDADDDNVAVTCEMAAIIPIEGAGAAE
jgi:hypothetical protein